MLQLLLTGLVGVALGVVIMRLLQRTENTAGAADKVEPASVPSAKAKGKAVPVEEHSEPGPMSLSDRFSALSKTQLAFGGAAALMLLAVAVMALRPNNDAAAAANSGTITGPGDKKLDDVDTMISRLEARLKANPTDGEGFRTLAWSYQNTGHPDKAIEAYRQAAKLLPGRGDIHVGLGEAMVSVAKDVVTPEAKAEFDQAIKIDNKEPRARFFLSLYKAQHGEERAALDEWIALSNSASADQPWQADVQVRIQKLATKLGVDIAGKLKAPAAAAIPADAKPVATGTGGPDATMMTAAGALPPAQQANMIDGMVEGLANKLKANPDDVEGWIKLIRSRIVLKDKAKAIDDLAMARKTFAKDPAKLGQLNSNIREFGL